MFAAARSYGFISLPLIAVLAACRDVVPPTVEPMDDLRKQVVEMGFRPDMIEDGGDHFVVEGDIVIYKSSLNRAQLPSRQYHTAATVSEANRNIVVDLSALESSWLAAAREAMAEWNAMPGLRLYFTEGSPASITMSMATFANSGACFGTAAQASFPSSGQPGPTINANSDWTSCATASQKKYLMVHELGHTVGFRHTNWNQNDCYPFSCESNPGSFGARLIPGTPTSGNDPASVMNGGTPHNSWAGFSWYDQVAALYLFGYATLTKANSNGHPALTAQFARGASSAHLLLETYRQELNDNGIQTYQYFEEAVTSFGTWELLQTHTDWRPWTSFVACGTPSAWSQPYEATKYLLRVIYPQGAIEVRTTAPVMDHSSWESCWSD